MWEQELLRYGYVLLFVGTIIEGEACLLAAAFLAHRGHLDLRTVMLVAFAANVLATEAYFHFARRRGGERLERRMATNRRYQRVRHWVCRRGTLLLFVSRFLVGLRIAVPAACGVCGMSARRFFLINVASTALWAVLLGLAGAALGAVLEQWWGNLRRYEWWIATALLASVSAWAAWRTRRRHPLPILLRHPEAFVALPARHLAPEPRPADFFALWR